MKIIINKCYGGFGLSDEAHEMLIEKGYPFYDNWQDVNALKGSSDWIVYASYYEGGRKSYSSNIKNCRTNKDVIEIVELLKEKASGGCADLKIIEIPDDIEYTIEEYDGIEWIAEKHRTWS